ncbi:MAG: Gfo/Idh/MocA family oxidoreductase, partial [Lentisphaeria bacterium]|nr:Gfo/Idh/MocA family oxidoreductase [Lentisphaeria bacterium]
MSKVVKLVVIGAGSRGNTYSTFATNFPDRAQVVAVVDPDADKRNRLADKCGVPAENRYNTWEEFVQLPKMADAVLICTQDAMHEGPAVACAKCGYDILL